MMKKIYRRLVCASVILFLLGTFSAYAQKQVVTGKITDATKLAMPGVNVILKGTTVGTTTDADGSFSIEAKSTDVLVVSFIGYATQEIAVGNQTKINFILQEDVATLQEVVVTGYGETTRPNLITAQNTISAKDMSRTVNSTIEQALQGRSAGVYVTQNSGQPGGGISVNIRGISTINGTTQPLYVIDGVQVQPSTINFGSSSSNNPLAGLNPADIASMEVLQGPSATAIYGSRAANGVILITTKRGKAGEMKVNYSLLYGVQTPPKHLEVMNLPQYAQMNKEYHDIEGGVTPTEFLDPSILGSGTDWQGELFNTAAMSQHQLSLSGGTEKTRYYMSGEYFNQDGIAIGSGFKRYSYRLNLDLKPREWFTVGSNFNFNQTNENLTTSQENIIQLGLQMTPQIPVQNIDGSWGGPDFTNGANLYSPPNPVALANLTTNEVLRRNFLGGLNMGFDIMKGLVFKTSLNINVGYSNSTYFQPAYRFGYTVNPTATLTEGTNQSAYWNWNQLLQYDKTFGKHTISVMASHEAQQSNWKAIGASRRDFLVDGIIDLNVGNQLTSSNSGGHGTWAMESYFGRINYNYDNRYLLTGTIRKDGSVNFGPDNKWGTFPSLAAAWRVSEETFFKVPAVSDFKLRYEVGVTGNQGDVAGIYSPLAADVTPWGTGFLPSRYGNPGLQWEQTTTNNFGLNLGVLQNRIQLDVDYYIKNTDNLLLDNPLPWYMGTNGTGSVGNPVVNVGALQNKGWGLTINADIIDKNDFKWNASLNISSFKTKITEFYSETAAINRTSWWLQNWTQRSTVGESPWLFYGYVEEGLFKSIEEIENSALPVDNVGNELPINEEDGVWVGDVKFKDVSGPDGVPDGIIDAYDQTIIGNPWPKSFWGLTNNFSYKGFNLSVLITAAQGNDIYNFIRKYNTNPNNINLSQNLLVDASNYARVTTDDLGNPILENPETNIARISNGRNGNYQRQTTHWVEDGSYIRLKNVTLSYNFPSSLLSKQKVVKALRLSVSGQNMATITKYTGMDPEVGSYVGRDASNSNQAVGLDYGRYPITPVYSFSLNVDF